MKREMHSGRGRQMVSYPETESKQPTGKVKECELGDWKEQFQGFCTGYMTAIFINSSRVHSMVMTPTPYKSISERSRLASCKFLQQ
jgi:hypothetical protein